MLFLVKSKSHLTEQGLNKILGIKYETGKASSFRHLLFLA